MLQKRLSYLTYTLVFVFLLLIGYLVIFRDRVNAEVYGAFAIIFMLGVGMCLVALSYMQRFHLQLKYGKVSILDEDGVLTFVGSTRFLGQKEKIMTFDLNKVKSLNLDFELYEPESHQIVFWDEDPELELTYFGLEQHNEDAKKVYVYPVAALKENKYLSAAFKEAFQPYIDEGKIFSELDLNTWKRTADARSEGVELLDTGAIVYKSTHK